MFRDRFRPPEAAARRRTASAKRPMKTNDEFLEQLCKRLVEAKDPQVIAALIKELDEYLMAKYSPSLEPEGVDIRKLA
jgi:hypothetical protein